MEDELEQPQKKIDLVTGLLGLIVCVTLDALSLIPFVGDIEDIPGALIFILNIVFGVGGSILLLQGTVMILKAIPGVQELPLWTPAWLIVWYTENRSIPVVSTVEKGIEVAGALEGGDLDELTEVGAVAEEASAGAEMAGEVGAEGTAATEAGVVAGEAGSAAEGTAEAGEATGQRTSRGEETTGEPEKGDNNSKDDKNSDGSPKNAAEREEANPMDNLQGDLLGAAEDQLSPQAPTPYQNDVDEDEEDAQ